jgi:Flp pilus assembly protein TadD
VTPGGVTPTNNLAMSLLLAGHPAEAIAVLETIAGRAGIPGRVGNNLAIARAAAGDSANARSMLSQREGAEDLDSLVIGLRPPG